MVGSSPIDVLLVDDSGFFRTIVSDKLDSSRHISVVNASDGEEAIEVLENQSIDCVVSDFQMPGMTGLELYRRLESEYQLPFILLTGEGTEETASRAISAGVDDYLRKDEIAEDGQLKLLSNRIENVVAQRKANKKYERLVNNTPDEIMQVTLDGTLVAANEAVARSFDSTQSELVGQHLADILPKETAAERLEHGRRAITAASPVTFQDTFGIRHFHNIAVPVDTGSEAGSFQLITRDITQQKRREQQLEDRTEELAVITRLVRHDINNDIQLLIGWADGARAHVDEEGEAFIDRIQETSNHIANLTSTARDFVDSLGDDAEFDLTGVDLAQILDNEIEKIDRRHEDVAVSVDGEIPDVPVWANELLSSVFSNLLSNAVRHNDADEPEVTVGVDEDDTKVWVRIGDNGPGIPESKQSDIFGKGEMGPESPGTGIGLYLVSTLVDQYGGDVWVEDRAAQTSGDGQTAPGDDEPTGAVFTVELPKHA